ncbi:MAG TPA: hypothetical protein VLH60_05315, partial [Sedimentisphaerales bacterium]|nr:hypothetical protein [Sedimentisphaerales bacterium]
MPQLLTSIDPAPTKSEHRRSRSRMSAPIPAGGGSLGDFQLDGVYLADCIQAMKSFPSASVDLAIAD